MQPEHHRPPHGATGKREDASASEMVDDAGKHGGLALIVAGLLIWQNHQQPASSTASKKPRGGKSSVASALPGDLADGLLLYFNFDKAPVAGKVPDLSGQGNNGKAVNVQWVADGHRGGSVVFGDQQLHHGVQQPETQFAPIYHGGMDQASFKDKAWRRIFDKSWDHGYDITMGGDDGGKSYQGQVMMEVAGAAAGIRGQVTDGRWHKSWGLSTQRNWCFTSMEEEPAGRERSNNPSLRSSTSRSVQTVPILRQKLALPLSA